MYLLEDRYTWYSNDRRTKKVLDYVLAEQFIQQYIMDCSVYSDTDIESDHRLILTTLITPETRKARRKQRMTTLKQKPDNKSLNEPNTKNTL